MLNAGLAQCILSLVTSPERAESTVGDLIEGLPTRDALKFWIASYVFKAAQRDEVLREGCKHAPEKHNLNLAPNRSRRRTALDITMG